MTDVFDGVSTCQFYFAGLRPISMHNDILDMEGCRVLAWLRSGIYTLIGIAWLKGGKCGEV